MGMKKLFVLYGNKGADMSYRIMESAGVHEKLTSSMKIGIKPNLVLSKPSSSGATTCPGVVEGIIKYLKDYGCDNITIMEGSWVGDSTDRAYKNCGYEEISKRYGVPLVDLKKDKTITLSHNEYVIDVCRSAYETDFLINVPVLKAHCQTSLTCALKNLKGCIPDSEKRRFHTLGLHKPIAVLNRLLKTGLIIVDGIIGDLTFEEGGNPVGMNRLILGTDPVLVDTYAARLIGYEPQEILYIAMAENLGVGTSCINSNTIVELNRDTFSSTPVRNTVNRVKRLSQMIVEDKACSACYGSLVHALGRLEGKGMFNSLKCKVHVGQGFKNKKIDGIGVGNCTRGFSCNIPGCPPSAVDIVRFLRNSINAKM